MHLIDLIKKNNIIQIIICLGIAISTAFLSVYLMIGKVTKTFAILSFTLTAVISFVYLLINRKKICKNIIKNKKSTKDIIVGIVLGLIIFYEFRLIGKDSIKFVNSNIIGIRHLHFLIIPSLICISIVCYSTIKRWFKKFYKEMDKLDRIIYITLSILAFIIIFIIYQKSNIFYIQYDKIYSLDSGWVYNNIFMKSHYYDVRHPLLSIITFPIYAIVDFTFSPTLKPVLLQFFNIQLLLLIGFMLKQLTNNRYVLFLYLVSIPTMIFSLFFEKYVLCTSLIVLYLYNNLYKKSDDKLSLSLAGCIMPTNAYIGIMELIKNKKLKDKILGVLKVVVIVLCLFVCFGRIQTFRYGIDELQKIKNDFANREFKISERFKATTTMIEHCFIGRESSEKNGKYLWNSVIDKISYIAIGIIVIILFGINSLKKKNKHFYIALLSGFLFSFVLFIGLNWAVYESPLFSILFSWSIIPLFVIGIERMLELLHVKKSFHKYLFIIIILFMLYKNIPVIFDILKYTKII